MATDERREHLLLVTDNLLAVWNAWAANSDVRYITRTFEDAINDALFVFGDGSIPGDLRVLHARMEVLDEHWQAWNEKNERSGGKHPIPDNAFWKALEAIEAARQEAVRPTRKMLESIAELTAQKVPDVQICRMYGFTDNGMPNGTPNIEMLREERANPGTHTDPAKGFLPPWEKKRQNDEQKQLEIIERIRRQRQGKMDLLTKVAAESIEQLIKEGVSGKQICRMKKIDESQLATYCEERGLEMPPWLLASGNLIAGDHDLEPDVEEPAGSLKESVKPIPVEHSDPSETDEAGEPMTLEQEIVMYHKTGTMTPPQIAEAVSRPGNEVSAKKVNAIVKRYEADPTAFETVSAQE